MERKGNRLEGHTLVSKSVSKSWWGTCYVMSTSNMPCREFDLIQISYPTPSCYVYLGSVTLTTSLCLFLCLSLSLAVLEHICPLSDQKLVWNLRLIVEPRFFLPGLNICGFEVLRMFVRFNRSDLSCTVYNCYLVYASYYFSYVM